jgi:hypothetical protein
VKKITETSKLNISLVETILSEEKCGEGMYWCNTNKECKPLPSGFNTPRTNNKTNRSWYWCAGGRVLQSYKKRKILSYTWYEI